MTASESGKGRRELTAETPREDISAADWANPTCGAPP
jgi:hypothetical protein